MTADALPAPTSTAPPPAECGVFELRQYTLHPRAREILIELFEREFMESQEACGAAVVGTFRDLDDPDRFVWLRGFAGMPARRQALADFYGGPVWKAHRDAANATMIDSDDVLLLRPAWAGSAFHLGPRARPPHDREEGESLVIARIYPFDAPVRVDFIDWFRREAMPLFEALGAQTVAVLATEEAKNDFTALPVRRRTRAGVVRALRQPCRVCSVLRSGDARAALERRTAAGTAAAPARQAALAAAGAHRALAAALSRISTKELDP